MKVYHNVDKVAPGRRADPLAEVHDLDMCLRFKYRLMWELRALEDEINAEPEGVIKVLWHTHEIETVGFSTALNNKIWDVIHSVNWDRW